MVQDSDQVTDQVKGGDRYGVEDISVGVLANLVGFDKFAILGDFGRFLCVKF